MKWRPHSIAGQLLTLSILGILVAHGIAVLVLTWWRADNATIHPLSVRTIETRIVSAYRAAARAADAASLLDDISLPESRFQLVAEPWSDEPRMDEQERLLADNLRQRLDLPPRLPVRVRLAQTDARQAVQDGERAPSWFAKSLRSDQAWALDVAIAYPGGQWLSSRHWPSMVPAHWSRVLSFSLLVGTVPTTIIAILFGRRIMRPLRRLTDASRRVSRGETVLLPQPSGPDGVREITQAFNDMQRSLMRFVNGRTQMIAAIGHDLRTPLTSLRIRAELIDDDELRDAMIQTLDEMAVIVDETLQFARDDVQREPTQEVLLDSLVGEVVESQRLQGRTVDWRVGEGAAIAYRCRPVHLKRALNNLIDNAARYGNVQVNLAPDRARQLVRIEVEDDGPGIASAQLEQVFEPFARLDSARSRATGGVGLGLAIARSCVRAHGGDVTLENRAEGGLRAVVELPG